MLEWSERSGEVLCIPQRALRRDTSTKPFREAEKRKRASQKSPPKKKARKDEPPPRACRGHKGGELVGTATPIQKEG